MALGLIAEDYDLDWNKVAAEYREAIELNPRNAIAHHFYGEYLAYMGHSQEGRAELQRAKELDPTSLIIAADYAESFILSRQYSQATQLAREILQLDPNFVRARLWLAMSLLMQGDCSGAENEVAKAERTENGPLETVNRGIIEASCGEPAKALADIAQLSKGDDSAWCMGAIYAVLGDKNKAFAALNRAIDERQVGLVNLKAHPLFDRFRSDPQFLALLARLRFPA